MFELQDAEKTFATWLTAEIILSKTFHDLFVSNLKIV